MVSSFNYPAGREVKPRDQPVPTDTPASDTNQPSPTATDEGVPASGTDPNSTPTPADHFVPSSALNDPQSWDTQTPAPSSTIVSTPDLPVSTSVTLPTGTPQPTPTAVSIQGASSAGSSNNKYIIGGAAGGGVLVLILLSLLLFCCCKRPRKRDLERSGGDHSEGQPGYGQFACCNHKTGVPSQMEQKTPLKPFILKSDPVASTHEERPQQHEVPLNRRDSGESQKSAGSDASVYSVCSSDSEGSQRGKRRSQKRPPPLKLTSLVTPVVTGPQNNPRRGSDHSLPPYLNEVPTEVPTIVVDPPPQSGTPDKMRQY